MDRPKTLSQGENSEKIEQHLDSIKRNVSSKCIRNKAKGKNVITSKSDHALYQNYHDSRRRK